MMTKGSKHVLVMDNGERYRLVMERYLRQNQIGVTITESFEQSLAAMRGTRDIGVIVTDTVDVNGTLPRETYLRELRAIPGERYTPLVAWTHVDALVERLQRELPIDLLIPKQARYQAERFGNLVLHLLCNPEAYRDNPRALTSNGPPSSEIWNRSRSTGTEGVRRSYRDIDDVKR